MDKYKTLFSRNLPWKIISLILGIMLWFIGMNVNNPYINKVFEVKLELRNIEDVSERGLILVNEKEIEEEKIKIKIRGSRRDIEELKKNKRIVKGYIDLSPMDITNRGNVGEDIRTTIHIEDLPLSYELISYTPKQKELKFDEITTIEKDITLLKKGKPLTGYEVNNINVEKNVVEIKGAKKELEKIAEVVAEVYIENASKDFNSKSELKIYDEEGKIITDKFTLEREYVAIGVKISKYGELEIIKPKLVGEIGENLEIIEVIVTPKKVKVIGDEVVLNKIKNIQIPDIEIEDMNYTTTITYDIYGFIDKYGLKIVDGEAKTVSVTIQMSKQTTKYLTIPTEDILIKGLKVGMELTDEIEIGIIGEDTIVENVKVEDLKISLDLRNIEEGVTEVEIDFELPKGIELLEGKIPIITVQYVKEDKEQINME